MSLSVIASSPKTEKRIKLPMNSAYSSWKSVTVFAYEPDEAHLLCIGLRIAWRHVSSSIGERRGDSLK